MLFSADHHGLSFYTGELCSRLYRIIEVTEFIDKTSLECLLASEDSTVCNLFYIFVEHLSTLCNSFNKLIVYIVEYVLEYLSLLLFNPPECRCYVFVSAAFHHLCFYATLVHESFYIRDFHDYTN